MKGVDGIQFYLGFPMEDQLSFVPSTLAITPIRGLVQQSPLGHLEAAQNVWVVDHSAKVARERTEYNRCNETKNSPTPQELLYRGLAEALPIVGKCEACCAAHQLLVCVPLIWPLTGLTIHVCCPMRLYTWCWVLVGRDMCSARGGWGSLNWPV
eukprot:1158359-Pelagomonas_calceolata.AAC.14